MKPKLIIVEGAIGSGKSSLSRLMRENMKHTTLLSLSSIGNNTAFNYFNYHANILNLLLELRGTDQNVILERSFISNRVYSMMGHNSYSFDQEFRILSRKLKALTMFYDVYVVLLCTNKVDFERRLGKRSKFELVDHTVDEALKQQRNYMILLDQLRNEGINCTTIVNSGMSKNQTLEFIMTSIGDE